MLEQQQETLEESWNNIFTVFYTYYGSRDEALKGDAAQIYEVIASDSDLADEFIVRFVERDDWSLEEKLYLATAALEDFPGAAHLKLCVQMLDFCIDVPKYFNSLFYCIVRFSFVHGKNIEGFDDNAFKAEALWPRYNAFIERHFGDFEFPHQEPTANPGRRAAFVTPQVSVWGTLRLESPSNIAEPWQRMADALFFSRIRSFSPSKTKLRLMAPSLLVGRQRLPTI